MQLELGTEVRCADEEVGRVADVVIDPVTRHLTHVVVETHDKQARLVPADLVSSCHRGDVELACSPDDLLALEPIRRFAYLGYDEFPAGDADADIGVEDVLAMPFYDATEIGDYAGELETGVSLTYDLIPKGDVELRRSSPVQSADGHRLGHVQSFLLSDGEITHLVLQHHHLLGARAVAIPLDLIDTIATDTVSVKLSRKEVEALPAIRVRRGLFS